MRRTLGLLAALQIVFWSAYLISVKPTNFAGIDEWLIAHLTSKGIVSFPYANRPLSLIWAAPAQWMSAGFQGYYWLSGVYVSLTGILVFRLCRLLAPGEAALAVLAGAFATLWGPRDPMRLSTIQGTVHHGFAFGAMLAVTLFVESWRRGSVSLLTAGAAAAIATTLSYEAVLPFLSLGLAVVPWRAAYRRSWLFVWAGVLVVGFTAAFVPPLGASRDYQQSLGLDLRPLWVGARLLNQYRLHLEPLAWGLPPLSLTAVIPATALVAAVAWAPAAAGDPAVLRRIAAMGIVAAGLAYVPYTLCPGFQGATRTQFLSAPGIAMFLASLFVLGASRMGPTLRQGATALLGAWVAVLGASNMTAMQAIWDRYGKFAAQRSNLAHLVAAVPDVKPHTLIILVGETGDVWPMAFSFRHAVAYFYQDRAAGTVVGVADTPYPTRFGRDGIVVTPWRQIQRPWGEPATVYGYDETIVVGVHPSGSLSVLPAWPGGSLPDLPPIARYEPSARIVSRDVEIPERDLLR